MKDKDQKSINNLKLRYQDYDRTGMKYAYDISYTTIHGDGETVKAHRETGADNFSRNIDELTNNYEGVATIIVSDYKGVSKKAAPINPPVVIEFIDVRSIADTPKLLVQQRGQQPQTPTPEPFNGLQGLFAGTEYEGLGQLAPVAKFIDDKHKIERLTEKLEEQKQRMADYESLKSKCDDLEDEVFELESELETYRKDEKKRKGYVDLAGAALVSGAKFLIKQHPQILSGIIPAEQLAGLFGDEPEAEPQAVNVSQEEQAQMDDATIVFEWLQSLPVDQFQKVISIIALLRQDANYINLIIKYLHGKQ